MNSSVDIIKSLSKKELIQLISTHFNMRQIFRTLNISYNKSSIHCFNKIVSEFKIKKSYLNSNNHPDIIEDTFKDIDSIEKAYWLGFIAADGYVPKDINRLSFSMSIKDEQHFNGFIKFINANKNYKKYYVGNYNNRMFQFSIYNKLFVDNIKKWGIISPKSKNLKFPNIKNKKMQNYFLLGLFDGDGSQKGELSSGSYRLLTKIKKIFKINKSITFHKNKFGSCYRLFIPVNIRRNLYKECSFNLKRKEVKEKERSMMLKRKCSCGNKLSLKDKKDCTYCSKTSKYSKNFLLSLLKTYKLLYIVAQHLNISSNALKKQLKKQKIDHKPFLKIQHGINHLDQEAIISYYNQSKSITDTSKKFNQSYDKIQKIVKHTDTYKNMKLKKLEVKKLKKQIIRMKKKYTFSQIAQILNLSVVYIKGLYYG